MWKKIFPKKVSQCRKKLKGTLWSRPVWCYAEKQKKTILVQFARPNGAIWCNNIFCRTFKNYFGQFVWIEKKSHYKSRVSLHEAPTKKERWQKKIEQKFASRKQGERIATWIVQRCKTRVDGRGRIQHIIRTIKEYKWDVVLLSDVASKKPGVWWYEENAVFVHSNRASVVLRNQWANDWK